MNTIKELATQSPLVADEEINLCLQKATLLSKRDIGQIAVGYSNGSFEMVSLFVFTKAMQALKKNLQGLGMVFLGELLEKPNIKEYDNVNEVVTDYEAISLARELGMMDETNAMYIRQAHEMVAHFSQYVDEDVDTVKAMRKSDASRILEDCISSILTKANIEPARQFSYFRLSLQEKLLSKDSPEVEELLSSPYFYQRLAISFLLSDIKSLNGAQLEHGLANLNILLPLMWKDLQNKEKWQVGNTYSEVYSEGKQIQASGIKNALLKVKGFDFVPETLRSRSFIEVAQKVIDAHYGMNNFYNEPGPMKVLSQLGTTLPPPALGKCITAILCVYLGNMYGTSWHAHDLALEMIKGISTDRLNIYFSQYLPTEMKILDKLLYDKPLENWFNLFTLPNFCEGQSDNRYISDILKDSKERKKVRLAAHITSLRNNYYVKLK